MSTSSAAPGSWALRPGADGVGDFVQRLGRRHERGFVDVLGELRLTSPACMRRSSCFCAPWRESPRVRPIRGAVGGLAASAIAPSVFHLALFMRQDAARRSPSATSPW
jgi:hypothetical protein